MGCRESQLLLASDLASELGFVTHLRFFILNPMTPGFIQLVRTRVSSSRTVFPDPGFWRPESLIVELAAILCSLYISLDDFPDFLLARGEFRLC